MVGKAYAIVCHNVIIINQVSRGTSGEDENDVGRARGGAESPGGRGAESEECRGAAAALVVALLFFVRKRAELLFR